MGSGKTTAIIGAARLLLAQGRRVGIVTNDQGRYLVDTAFVRASLPNVPAVEVTGGCFCCNYDDLNTRLEQIVAAAGPDVIFAESVGSCADLVATVVKPLLQLAPGRFAPASFSVFADARLLRRRLLGHEMPFSDDVVYIFDQQMAEAGLLVVNKADLLRPPELEETRRLVERHFAGRPVQFQNSLEPEGVGQWLERIEGEGLKLSPHTLEMDYARYAAGEAGLAWLDEEIHLEGADACGFVQYFVAGMVRRLRENGAGIGHVKLLLRGAQAELKLSLTAGDDLAAPQFDCPPGVTGLTLNARVQIPAAALRTLTASALGEAALVSGVAYRETDVEYFHPGYPKPTHKIG